jgi:hypothetical protein
MRLIIIVVSLLYYTSNSNIYSNKLDNEFCRNYPCLENSDSIYNRIFILNDLAKVLNKSVPKFKKRYDPLGFYVENGKPKNFFIFDLTDTLNKSFPSENDIEFKENHIYHFAPLRYEYSFSHLVILKNGRLKIFRSINCEKKGDKLQMVLDYLKEIGINDEKTMENILNYRKFGIYLEIDPQSIILCHL